MHETEEELLRLMALGDKTAIGKLFTKYHQPLLKLIAAKIDPRISARMDESDVLQEVHMEVQRRYNEFQPENGITFYGWLRFLAKQKLVELVRKHVHTQARDVRREVPLHDNFSGESSLELLARMSGPGNSPSSHLEKSEVKETVNYCLKQISPDDRHILFLRHVEHLNSAQIAIVLDISQNTCRQRYLRALKNLRAVMVSENLSSGDINL